MSKVDMNLLKHLSEAFGVSGRERQVREVILSEIRSSCDEIKVDNIGNIIAKKHGKNNKNILIMASMDEPGFIISGYKEGGGAFLSFEPVGIIRPQSVVSESVVVGDKMIPGIISLKAVHLSTKEEREKLVCLKDLFIDIGADNKQAAEREILIGDFAGFKSKYTELGEYGVSNKAIGQRACCAVLAALLKADYDCSITCVFTVQKQVGLRGAKLSFGSDDEFDEAITLDTIEEEQYKLGSGCFIPCLINSTCHDRSIAIKLMSMKDNLNIENKDNDIKCEIIAKKIDDGDITSVNIKGKGILTAELDIPVKNKNTSSEIVDKRDIDAAYQIISKYLES